MYACLHSSGDVAEPTLVALAGEFSPLVEQTSADTVVFDISGTKELFGPPEFLAAELRNRAQAIGLTVNVAVADNPDAAILVARNVTNLYPVLSRAGYSLGGKLTVCPTPDPVATAPGTVDMRGEGYSGEDRYTQDINEDRGGNTRGVIVVPPDKQRAVLSPLPLEALDPLLVAVDPRRATEILETLNLWGLETLGDFAALPEKGIGETLGEAGVKLHKLARGTNRRTLRFVVPKREFRQSLELDSSIDLIEQLSFVVSHLVHRLCRDLARYGLALIEIRLEAKLDDRSVYGRKLRLPFPMSDPHWLSRLIMMDVETSPPPSAIVSVTLEAEPVKPRSQQKGLFEPLTPEPEKLELTLARLARLVGGDNVGSPEVLNTHRPDSFRLKSFTLPKKSAILNFSTPQVRSLLSLRMFRPPLPLEVAQTVSLRPLELRAHSLSERWHSWRDQSTQVAQTVSLRGSLPAGGEPTGRLEVKAATSDTADESHRRESVEVAQTVSLRNPLKAGGDPTGWLEVKAATSDTADESNRRESVDGSNPAYKSDGYISRIPPAEAEGLFGSGLRPRTQGSKLTVCSTEDKAATSRRTPKMQDSVSHSQNSKLTVCSTHVVRESGPWLTSGNWWADPGYWTREEWDIALNNGVLYRIFRDVSTGGWFVEGVYD